MKKETKITIVAVGITVLLSIIAFVSVHTRLSADRPIGGEGLLLLLPVITYMICRNISLSIDVFRPKKSDAFENIETHVVSSPRKMGAKKSKLQISMNFSDQDE